MSEVREAAERRCTFFTVALRTAWLPVLAGCFAEVNQNALDPRGPQAGYIADWFWFSFVLAVVVFVTYCAILGYALWRARRNGERNDLPPRHGWNLVLWGGVLVPALILLLLIGTSAYTDRRLSLLTEPGAEVLTIEVVGHQFWWEVRYRDPANPHREFTTANEIHIPVGQPVRFRLESRDVIHSFWVPNLHGKTDLIPRRTNVLELQADRPGIYRGQCAEFCGSQHAKMAFLVIAQPPEDFALWYEHQLQPGLPPTDSLLLAGQQVFMSNGCAICHRIRGTLASASVAPDLTHFGSRRTLAAGILPNTRGHLGGWISDPQGIKPGNKMPAVPIDSESLQALLSYLHSLK